MSKSLIVLLGFLFEVKVWNSKTVVFMVENPLFSRDYDRFGFALWKCRNWNVVIFDITKIKNKSYWEYLNIGNLRLDYPNLKIFEETKSVLDAIDELQGNCVFVDLLGCGYLANKCRKRAKKRGHVVQLFLSSIPTRRVPILKKVREVAFNPNIFFQRLEKYIYSHFTIYPSHIVVGGSKAEEQIPLGKSKVIRAHNLDYDLTLSDRNAKTSNKKPYLLFLDEDVCYHPDYLHAREKPAASENRYFATMNAGLTEIAKNFDFDVIIAAHPRSDYDEISKKFEFPVVQNKTYELITNASLVVAHGSTSIQLAIIEHKPIILVTTEELENSLCFEVYDQFRRDLNKPVIDLDCSVSEINWSKVSKVEKGVYRDYFEKYIKQNGTPDKLVWHIIIDSLDSDCGSN